VAAYHQAMSFKLFGVVVLFLYAVATIVALVIKVRDVGLLEGLSVWRKAPRRTMLIVLEVAGVATAAAGATYSTRWTAVVWTVVGIALAYALVRTLHKKSDVPSAQTLQTSLPARKAGGGTVRQPERRRRQPASRLPRLAPRSHDRGSATSEAYTSTVPLRRGTMAAPSSVTP